jgi:CRISPR-associated endoribonuclease Cas6
MSDLRLYAIVLRLTALRPGAVPHHHGDFARDALLDLINKGDTELASTLHDQNDHKPYTIAPLRGGKRGTDGAHHFGVGDEAFWRFTLLCEPAFEAVLRRYVLNRAMPHMRIGAVEFGITDAFASNGGHPESGHVTISALQERWSIPPETLPRAYTLEFLTPTAFNLGYDRESKRRNLHTLPTPRFVLSALRKQWLTIGGAAPDDEFDRWVESNIEIASLDIHTDHARIKGNMLPGFTGRVLYRVRRDDRWWGVAHLLAAFAYWRGCGYQTTCGMGQVRPVLTGPMESNL